MRTLILHCSLLIWLLLCRLMFFFSFSYVIYWSCFFLYVFTIYLYLLGTSPQTVSLSSLLDFRFFLFTLFFLDVSVYLWECDVWWKVFVEKFTLVPRFRIDQVFGATEHKSARVYCCSFVEAQETHMSAKKEIEKRKRENGRKSKSQQGKDRVQKMRKLYMHYVF